jgi:PAS domain S-box-containing protein
MASRVDSGSEPESIPAPPERHDSLHRLHEAALAITASLDLEQVLGEIQSHGSRLAGDAVILIYLAKDTGGSLELVRGGQAEVRDLKSSLTRFGDPVRAEDGARLLLARGDSPASRAAAAGRAIVVQDARAENEDTKRFGPSRAVRSLIAVPMIYSGDVLGVIETGWPAANSAGPQVVEQMEMLAAHAAVAVSHARLFERSREMLSLMQGINDRSAAVSGVAQAILDAAHDLHRMLAESLQRVLSLLGLKAGSILLANPTRQELHVVVHYRFPQDGGALAARQKITPTDPGLAAHAALGRQPILVQDVERDLLTLSALEALRRFGIGALAALPLISDDDVIGVLLVGAESGASLEAGTFDTLRVIAGELGQGVANARIFSRIRAEQEKFNAVISSSGDVVLSFDHQGRITLANDAAQRAFGFSVEETIGKPLPQVTTNVALNSAVEQAIRSETRERIGFEVPLADESVLFCNLSPIVDEDERVTGWVAVMQDITHLKETERLKSDMILTASHDLRNPVNLTLGALDMLGQGTDNWTSIQREVLDLAVMGARRIEALITDLLDLERVERRVGLVQEACNLTDIATTVYVENKMQAHHKQQVLEARLSEGLPAVWGDPKRLYQVVSNLVGNAIKYTPSGGQIAIQLRRANDHLLLEVSDNGNGIPQEAQARIFERFYRVAGSSSIDATGTGLGLALVKTIVEQHGGRVWVTSAAGHGSTFSVSLPIWNPSEPSAQPIGQPAAGNAP